MTDEKEIADPVPPPGNRRRWLSARIRLALREQEMSPEGNGPRGRKLRLLEPDLIQFYVEIEARKRFLGETLVGMLRNHPFQRLDPDTRAITRLTLSERRTVRRLHSAGQRELEAWRAIRFLERPHPQAAVIDRRVEARVVELSLLPKANVFTLTLP